MWMKLHSDRGAREPIESTYPSRARLPRTVGTSHPSFRDDPHFRMRLRPTDTVIHGAFDTSRAFSRSCRDPNSKN